VATFEEIKSVRLEIDDPPGFIDFQEVATLPALPAAPAQQTAYKVIADGAYYATDKTSGVATSDYERQTLALSDSRISTIIDADGEAEAVKQGFFSIKRKLGKEIIMVRNTDGTESTEYQRLLDLLDYYDRICAGYEEDQDKKASVNTGRFFTTADPVIGEGNV